MKCSWAVFFCVDFDTSVILYDVFDVIMKGFFYIE